MIVWNRTFNLQNFNTKRILKTFKSGVEIIRERITKRGLYTIRCMHDIFLSYCCVDPTLSFSKKCDSFFFFFCCWGWTTCLSRTQIRWKLFLLILSSFKIILLTHKRYFWFSSNIPSLFVLLDFVERGYWSADVAPETATLAPNWLDGTAE